jgi:hypothetical protein
LGLAAAAAAAAEGFERPTVVFKELALIVL